MDRIVSIAPRAPLGFRLPDLPAVVERELRVASRRSATYWGRVSAASVAIAVAGWWMAGFTALGVTPQMGRAAFRVVAGVAAFMLLSSVIRLTAEAFAREKREDTLGLLFVTPLTPRELVFGKLVSSTLGAFYNFVAVVPVIALPMLGGGVTFGNFALLVLVVINLAFFSAALGLYVSANCWDEKRAASVANLTLFGVLVLPAALATAFAMTGGWGPALRYLYAISPAYAVWQATMTGLRLSSAFWWSVVLTHIGGWLFFLATCGVLPRCWQEKPNEAQLQRQVRRLREAQLAQDFRQAPALSEQAWNASPVGIARKAVHRQLDSGRRTRLLERNPVAWFALRWRAQTAGPWILGAVAFVGLLTIPMTANPAMFMSPGFALFICYLFNTASKVYVATQAAFAFARDRPENSLELLLATPVTPQELVQGNVIALREPLRKTVRAMLLVEAGWLGLTFTVAGNRTTEELVICIVIGVAMLTLLLPDLYAVGWVALWEGAVAKDSRTAASNAHMKVLCFPWLVLLGFIALAEIFGGFVNPWFAIAVLVSGSALGDGLLARRARQKLRTELPERARRRASGEVEYYGGWIRLGRWLGQRWRSAVGVM